MKDWTILKGDSSVCSQLFPLFFFFLSYFSPHLHWECFLTGKHHFAIYFPLEILEVPLEVLPPVTSQQPLEWCQLCFYLAGRCENVHVQKSRCQASTSCNWKGKKEYRTHWGIKQASLRSTTFKKNYEVAFMELGTLLLTLKQQLDLSTQA